MIAVWGAAVVAVTREEPIAFPEIFMTSDQ